MLALINLAPDSVTCENCGSPWWIPLASLAISALAIYVASRTLRHSREMRDMMRVEHEVRLEQMAKKPSIQIRSRWSNGDTHAELRPNVLGTTLRIEIENVGTLWVENAVVTISLPKFLFKQPNRLNRRHPTGGYVETRWRDLEGGIEYGENDPVPALFAALDNRKFLPGAPVILEFSISFGRAPDLRFPVAASVTDIHGNKWDDITLLSVQRKVAE